jgi:hypothetical protein
MEDKTYDAEGQVLTGSFMDYATPRAEDFCNVVIEDNPVPTPTNPLGVKGAGEAGTVGSLSAGVNAIVDALSVPTSEIAPATQPYGLPCPCAMDPTARPGFCRNIPKPRSNPARTDIIGIPPGKRYRRLPQMIAP